MQVIKKTVKNMKKRLCLAECDIDLALKYKDTYPEYAKNQYTLSVELMNQFKSQHDHIVQIINVYKREGKEIPKEMQAIYDYIHEEYTDWSAEIKAKQEMYK